MLWSAELARMQRLLRTAQHVNDSPGPRYSQLQFRVDAQNLFNRQQWNGPTTNPQSTQFGQVTTVALNQMRFFTFGIRTTF